MPHAKLLRLQFLARVVKKEIHYLQITDKRLFFTPFTGKMVAQLEKDEALAERVDAFVSRFGRLQDTVGDKLLPCYPGMLGESVGPVIDNLNRAEKFGLINSTEVWMALRNLRNQMVHEYMEDADKLAAALNKGHEHVATLCNDTGRILTDLTMRGWIE